MANMKVNGDFRELNAWIDNIKTNLATRQVDQWIRLVVQDAATEFIKVLQKHTPKGPTDYKIYLGDEIPGTLRKAWATDNVNMRVVKHAGGNYQLTLVNTTKYADWVNYGHYQRVGRYVWTINGYLIKPFVSGTYFVELAEKDFQENIDNVIKKLTESWLSEVFTT